MPKKTPKEKTKQDTKTPGTAQDPAPVPAPSVPASASDHAPEVVDKIESTCFEIAREYINTLDDPEEIKDNNGLFVDMLKDIYKKYLVYVLGNDKGYNNRYDYQLLDKLFDIYTRLCYRLKKNKRPNMLEFTIFTHTSRQILYNAVYNQTKKLTPKDIQCVKRWFTECENSLVNGSGVFEIFLLKSQYRYNDNLAPLPVSDQTTPLSVGELPDLGLQKIAKNGSDDPNKQTPKSG